MRGQRGRWEDEIWRKLLAVDIILLDDIGSDCTNVQLVIVHIFIDNLQTPFHSTMYNDDWLFANADQNQIQLPFAFGCFLLGH